MDHIDGIRMNNTRANLRLVTSRQNSLNRERGQDHGVHKTPNNTWQAVVYRHYKQCYLGTYMTQQGARDAVKQFMQQFIEYEEYARK